MRAKVTFVNIATRVRITDIYFIVYFRFRRKYNYKIP